MRLIGRPISVGLCAAAFLTAAIGCALAQDTDKQDADKGQTELRDRILAIVEYLNRLQAK